MPPFNLIKSKIYNYTLLYYGKFRKSKQEQMFDQLFCFRYNKNKIDPFMNLADTQSGLFYIYW